MGAAAASLWDYVVILGWLAVPAVGGFALRAFLPPAAGPPSLPATDLAAFGFGATALGLPDGR